MRLQNMKKESDPEQRKVIGHDHNLTIEIGDARPPRPAILRMRRAGINSFEYWVYRSPSKAYRHCRWMLENLAEPTSGERLWIVI